MIKFISFCAGNKIYYEAANRLKKSVEKTNSFDEIKIFNENDLKKDVKFWSKHNEFINKNLSKGFGYWIWKPYIIKKCFDQLNDGDILFYLDADCILETNKVTLDQYFEQLKKDLIIGSLTNIEKNWTKNDLIMKLDMNHQKYLNTSQRQGGTNMFLINEKTRMLVNEWYNLACQYDLLDDSIKLQNIESFKEHRHDQSIFSLLSKKYDIYSDLSLFNIIRITSLK